MKKRIVFGVIAIALFFGSPLAFAVTNETFDVTLQWDANKESDLAGYNVYYDIDQSGPPYENIVSVPLGQDENTAAELVEKTIVGLQYGTVHWFVVTAYDTEDFESGFSNEVFTDGEIDLPPSEPAGLGILKITIHRSDGTTVIIEVP